MVPTRGWNARFGRAAEAYAARWLATRGLRVVECGFHCSGGELDIVARDGPTWVIVEVKARTSSRWGTPAESVGFRKRRRIVAATRRLLWERGALADPVRFDVVEIARRDGRLSVSWIRDAFTA